MTSELILVTGSSGFIGSYVVSQLLERGSHVRAVARSESSTSGLRQAFDEYVKSGALTFAYVPDMTAEGAYDEAMKHVTGVIHVASPLSVRMQGDARKSMLDPAIKGATSIITAAAKQNTVKSVVLTTSIVAFTNVEGPNGKVVSETDWNPVTIEEAETSTDPDLVYKASKTHAEKAAWATKEKLGASFRFSTIGPVFVGGATILPGQSVSEGTNAILYGMMCGKGSSGALADQSSPLPWVSVVDVARAHLLALDKPEADGVRFILEPSDDKWMQADVQKVASKVDPSYKVTAPSDTDKKAHQRWEVRSNENSKKILGLTYTPIEQIIEEVSRQALKERSVSA